MIDACGLPDFCLTLTADNTQDLEGEKINDLEGMLHRCNVSFIHSFIEAPAECAIHFLQCIDDFMALHILDKQGGILSKVAHYVIRIEVQHHASLHAHIVVWCDPTTMEATIAQFVAQFFAA